MEIKTTTDIIIEYEQVNTSTSASDKWVRVDDELYNIIGDIAEIIVSKYGFDDLVKNARHTAIITFKSELSQSSKAKG